MLTARELSESGFAVTILDRHAVGKESSWAGGGILSPLYPWRYPDPVNELAVWGQKDYPDLAKKLAIQTGIDPEWTQSGLLLLDEEAIKPAVSWAVSQNSQVEVLERDAIRACEQQLGPYGEKAVWLPEIAQIRNPRLIQALRRSLEVSGVDIKEHVEVESLLVENGQIQGVTSSVGKLMAGKIVIAGGAWSASLLSEHGLSIPVKPVRGQMLLYRTEPGLISRIVLSNGRYVIPRRDGHVLVGSTVEDVGFDKSTTDQALAELKFAAESMIPKLASHDVIRHWAGLRPGSAEGVPLISKLPDIDGLYINAGHFRNGVVLGPASARLLTDIILDRRPIVHSSPYAVKWT